MMGSSCSSESDRSTLVTDGQRQERDKISSKGPYFGSTICSSLRHAIVESVPDRLFDSLYPSIPFVDHGNGLRSPKSLAELATESLCRALPRLRNELPTGLPPDVVNDIVRSLIAHSAINPTTLRTLRNCELSGELSLAGCRGVTDEWLAPLSKSPTSPMPALAASYLSDSEDSSDKMDLDSRPKPSFCASFGCDKESSSSFSSSSSDDSFVSAHSGLNSMIFDADNIDDVSPPPPPPTLPPIASANCITMLDLRGSHRLTDRGLLQLAELPYLEAARLDHCHSIIGPGLHVLASSHRLHTLSLSHCRRLTDEGLIVIAHLTSLENLILDGCRCLTDRSLVAISDMTELRKLDLSQCDLVTDEGLNQLDRLSCLEEMSVAWCRQITDHGLALLCTQLGRSETLRVLRLARCLITNEGAHSLGKLLALEELDLNGCAAISGQALANALQRMSRLTTIDVSYCPGILKTSWQGKIPNVKTLELRYSSVKDYQIHNLTSLPTLEELNLDSCRVGDSALRHIVQYNVMPNLQSLELADSEISDVGLVHLGKLKTLTKLSLFYCNISNFGLRHVSKLTNLHTLNLDSRDIDDHGIRHLKALRKLKHLDVFSGRITDAGCGHISTMRCLESLELCGGGVGDLGCTLLACLENLTSLNLSQNERITNVGAAALASLHCLKALNLSNTRVTSHALHFFEGLRQLQSLALYGCHNIDNEFDLCRLRQSVPSLKCLRRHCTPEEEGTCVAMGDEDYVRDIWEDDDMDQYSDHD